VSKKTAKKNAKPKRNKFVIGSIKCKKNAWLFKYLNWRLIGTEDRVASLFQKLQLGCECALLLKPNN